MRKLFIFILWLAWITLAVFVWCTIPSDARLDNKVSDTRLDYYTHLLESAHAIIAAILFWVLAIGLGWRICYRYFLLESSPREQATLPSLLTPIFISMGLGLGLYAAAILLFGIVIGVSLPQILLLHIILIALVGRSWIEIAKQIKNVFSEIKKISWDQSQILKVLIVAFVIFSVLPVALAPNLFPDTLRYHFGLTKIYQDWGRIFFMPDFGESNTSLNWQMLYLGQIIFAGDISAQIFNWLALPLTLGIVALTVSPKGRWLAIWVIVSTPFLLGVSAEANNDLGVLFFCALMWLAVKSPFLKHRWFLSGLFAGLAFGTKYPSLLAGIALLLALFTTEPTELRVRLKRAGIFIVGIFIGYLPWFCRNILWTGDPIYPLLSHWLPWAENGRWFLAHYGEEMARYGSDMYGLMRWLTAPWRTTMAVYPYFESELGLIVWAILPLLILGIWKAPKIRLAIIATLIFGVIWSAGPQVTRFLAAGMPAFAIAGGEIWAAISSLTLRRWMIGIFTILVSSNIWVTWLAIT